MHNKCHCKHNIEELSKKGDISEMRCLTKMFCENLDVIKETHPELYMKENFKIHEMLYGQVMTMDLAEWWVSIMKPMPKWTCEETASVMSGCGFTEAENFCILNMIYSDSKSKYGNGDTEESIMEYKNAAKEWMKDEDVPAGKLYRYFKCVVLGIM